MPITAVAAFAVGILLASLGIWPVLCTVGICAYLLLPFRAILAAAVALAFYRLPTPSFSLGPDLSLDLADLSIILLALRILFRETKLLFGASPTEWLLSLGLSQALANALSVATALSPIRALAETLNSVIWAVVILGVARWLRAGSAGDSLTRLRFVFLTILAASLFAAVIALFPSTVGLHAAPLYAPIVNGTAIRVSGVSGGFLSGLLIVGIVMALGLLGSEPRWRWPVTGVLLLLCATVWQTYTRGAIIDLVAATALMLAWPRAPRYVTGRVLLCGLGIGTFLLVALTSANAMRSRFMQLTADPSSSTTLDTRTQLWGTGIEILERRPVLGVGAGNFNLALRTYVPDRLPNEFYVIYHYPEQQILGLLDETGGLGTATYLFSLIFLIHRMYLFSRLHRHEWKSSQQAPLVLSVLVLLITRMASELAGTSLSGNALLLMTSGLALGIISDHQSRTSQLTQAANPPYEGTMSSEHMIGRIQPMHWKSTQDDRS